MLGIGINSAAGRHPGIVTLHADVEASHRDLAAGAGCKQVKP